MNIGVLGLMACVFTVLMVGSQCWKTLTTKKTRDLSLISLVCSVLETGLWMLYSTFTYDIALCIAATLSVIMYSILLIMKSANMLREGEE